MMRGCLSLLITLPLILIAGLLGFMGVAAVFLLNLLFLPFEIIFSFLEGGKRG
jgi:hypothetical protein